MIIRRNLSLEFTCQKTDSFLIQRGHTDSTQNGQRAGNYVGHSTICKQSRHFQLFQHPEDRQVAQIDLHADTAEITGHGIIQQFPGAAEGVDDDQREQSREQHRLIANTIVNRRCCGAQKQHQPSVRCGKVSQLFAIQIQHAACGKKHKAVGEVAARQAEVVFAQCAYNRKDSKADPRPPLIPDQTAKEGEDHIKNHDDSQKPTHADDLHGLVHEAKEHAQIGKCLPERLRAEGHCALKQAHQRKKSQIF